MKLLNVLILLLSLSVVNISQARKIMSDSELIHDIHSNNATKVIYAAKTIYKGRYNSPTVLKEASIVLLRDYKKRDLSDRRIDALSWIIKALWVSGDTYYRPIINEVRNNAYNRKVRKYAKAFKL